VSFGGIDVEVAEGDGPWRAAGAFDEAGPIAGDLRVVPFEGSGASPLRVRLRLARGHWRLDAVALAALGEPLSPVRLEPASVERDGRRDDGARARLLDGERHLVTHPGDSYRLTFRLPPGEGAFDPGSLREVRVRRHKMTAGWALRWGLVGGLASGAVMAAACSSVEGNDSGG